MMSPTLFYVYQCANCKSTYTTLVPTTGTGTAYRCLTDRSPMRFLHARSIVTDEDRAVAARCPVWNGGRVTGEVRRAVRCDACPAYVVAEHAIDLGAAGTFCSQACADTGSERHRCQMARMDIKLEELYQQMPWLRPQAKESA